VPIPEADVGQATERIADDVGVADIPALEGLVAGRGWRAHAGYYPPAGVEGAPVESARGYPMTDQRQMSAADWRLYFDELRERAKDPAAALSLEDFRALAHLELIDRVKELEGALGNVERALRYSRQI
jgi:hypothetical protein